MATILVTIVLSIFIVVLIMDQSGFIDYAVANEIHTVVIQYLNMVLLPVLLLLVMGLAFPMVGFALDRIFNPRLHSR